tara:strand:- start:353 stop:1075 length:723 start_codon:yes stop_codon:yes gene_type:complete
MIKVLCIIQARLGSTRLPGKVLFPGADNKPLLLNLFERVKKSKYIDKIIIATTKLKNDFKIVKICKKNNIEYFRGSNKNVLDRYYNCALKYKAKKILRITADCPLLEYKFIDNFIYKSQKKKLDYFSNCYKRTFPKGYDLELFDFKTLEYCKKNAKSKYDKEHVTPYIIRNLPSTKFGYIKYKRNLYKKYRLTLDYKSDYLVIKNIFDNLYLKDKFFDLKKIIKYLNKSKIWKLNIKNNQ